MNRESRMIAHDRIPNPASSVNILGTPISLVTMNGVLCRFDTWINSNRGHYVVVRDVHGVMRARIDDALDQAHHGADLVTPDGMPLVWSAMLKGHKDIERVSGPDLLPAVCAYGLDKGWRHFFYGGAPGLAETLADRLCERFPGIVIVGTRCPPFRTLSFDEDEGDCQAITSAKPDFVWVGLGTPKQEVWMASHHARLGGLTLIGVGAAFDFHSRRMRRAPLWMQQFGLEWTFRLISEPRRLWKRYLILGSKFLFLSAIELIAGRRRD